MLVSGKIFGVGTNSAKANTQCFGIGVRISLVQKLYVGVGEILLTPTHNALVLILLTPTA